MSEVISIERIQREAKAAAHKFALLSDACPYPWGSDAAHAFAAAFKAERQKVTTPLKTPCVKK